MSDAMVSKAPAIPAVLMDEGGIQLRTLDEAWRWATGVVKSGLAPKGLDTPEKVLVALQTGLEAGLKPMAALRAVVVINGLPSWKGDQALALVRASGLLESFRSNTDDAEAMIVSKRKGGDEHATKFTVADAKRAGLWGKQGPWTQYPQRMLYYRALGFHLRDYYSDVLMGLAISEEIADYAPTISTAPQAALPATVADPLFDEPAVAEVVEVDPATGERIPDYIRADDGQEKLL